MHELAATQNILETALQHALNAGARRITALHLVVGQMSEMRADSVQLYWDSISPGTPAEGARLHFRPVSLELHCQECQHRYAPSTDDVACPACGSERVRLLIGAEFYLEAIDVEATSPLHDS
jgi:hydrogenase nickel incorporation protein HypA/HybF